MKRQRMMRGNRDKGPWQGESGGDGEGSRRRQEEQSLSRGGKKKEDAPAGACAGTRNTYAVHHSEAQGPSGRRWIGDYLTWYNAALLWRVADIYQAALWMGTRGRRRLIILCARHPPSSRQGRSRCSFVSAFTLNNTNSNLLTFVGYVGGHNIKDF